MTHDNRYNNVICLLPTDCSRLALMRLYCDGYRHLKLWKEAGERLLGFVYEVMKWSLGYRPCPSVRMWPSVCDRNVCRLFIKFRIADLFARNCEAILTLVPSGPATVTICLGQRKGLRYFPHFPTDLGEIRYRQLHKAVDFRENPCGGDCTL
jgi:hypothetical protein